MPEPILILAMKDDSETGKIIQTLAHSNHHLITVFNWKNQGWEKLRCENSMVTTEDNPVDPESIDPVSLDIVIMDEEIQDNIQMYSILEKIRELDIPLIFITSNSNNTLEGIQINQKEIYLSRPFETRELILTMQTAFYKKNVERALRESENKYRILIENADDPIAIVDYQGKFTLVNKSAAIFFSCEEEKFQGKTMWELFPPEIADLQMNNIRKVIDTGEGRIFENKSIIQGKEYYFSTNIQPMPRKNGEVGSVQLIARDITP